VSRVSDELEGSGYDLDDVFVMAVIDNRGITGPSPHPLDDGIGDEIGDSINE